MNDGDDLGTGATAAAWTFAAGSTAAGAGRLHAGVAAVIAMARISSGRRVRVMVRFHGKRLLRSGTPSVLLRPPPRAAPRVPGIPANHAIATVRADPGTRQRPHDRHARCARDPSPCGL